MNAGLSQASHPSSLANDLLQTLDGGKWFPAGSRSKLNARVNIEAAFLWTLRSAKLGSVVTLSASRNEAGGRVIAIPEWSH
jgi:hypothetical protein